MILSGEAIKRLLKSGEIKITPEPIIKEASVKIHFSGEFGINRSDINNTGTITLQPKEFILGLSKEKISLSDKFAGFYDGYIGLSSQRIMSHIGSMFIDPGFSGQILLEIFNISDKVVTLEKNMRAGHLIIFEVSK